MSLPADFLSGEAILLHYQWSGRRRAEGVYPNDGDSGTDKGLPSYRGISLNDQDWHIRGQNPFSVIVRLRCEQACARHALRARRQAPLPLDLVWQKQLAAALWPTTLPPEVIQGAKSPLRAFIREYLFVLLFQACAGSLASENASRLAAMQRAEKNIDGFPEDLNLKLHRIRQESIDEELFDVISGYEALTAVRRQR